MDLVKRKVEKLGKKKEQKQVEWWNEVQSEVGERDIKQKVIQAAEDKEKEKQLEAKKQEVAEAEQAIKDEERKKDVAAKREKADFSAARSYWMQVHQLEGKLPRASESVDAGVGAGAAAATAPVGAVSSVRDAGVDGIDEDQFRTHGDRSGSATHVATDFDDGAEQMKAVEALGGLDDSDDDWSSDDDDDAQKNTNSEAVKAAGAAGAGTHTQAKHGESSVGGDDEDDDDLPEGWEEEDDLDTGETYWWNRGTGETSWTKPVGAAQKQKQAELDLMWAAVEEQKTKTAKTAKETTKVVEAAVPRSPVPPPRSESGSEHAFSPEQQRDVHRSADRSPRSGQFIDSTTAGSATGLATGLARPSSRDRVLRPVRVSRSQEGRGMLGGGDDQAPLESSLGYAYEAGATDARGRGYGHGCTSAPEGLTRAQAKGMGGAGRREGGDEGEDSLEDSMGSVSSTQRVLRAARMDVQKGEGRQLHGKFQQPTRQQPTQLREQQQQRQRSERGVEGAATGAETGGGEDRRNARRARRRQENGERVAVEAENRSANRATNDLRSQPVAEAKSRKNSSGTGVRRGSKGEAREQKQRQAGGGVGRAQDKKQSQEDAQQQRRRRAKDDRQQGKTKTKPPTNGAKSKKDASHARFLALVGDGRVEREKGAAR
jgi:hypothetical protein